MGHRAVLEHLIRPEGHAEAALFVCGLLGGGVQAVVHIADIGFPRHQHRRQHDPLRHGVRQAEGPGGSHQQNVLPHRKQRTGGVRFLHVGHQNHRGIGVIAGRVLFFRDDHAGIAFDAPGPQQCLEILQVRRIGILGHEEEIAPRLGKFHELRKFPVGQVVPGGQNHQGAFRV